MPRDYISYDFYRYSAGGVQKRFFRTGRITSWSHLESVLTVLIAAQKRWQTVLIFKDSLRVKLSAGRVPFSSSGLERYAAILSLACAKAPPGASIDETTRDIATWGTLEVRRMTKQGTATLADADTLYARAANQRAWLEHKKALQTVRRAIALNPRHDQALALRVALLSETGAAGTVIFAAADEWARECPNDREAILSRLRTGILAGDERVIEQAAAVLSAPPHDPTLTFILADYYFRERRYAQAINLLDHLADTTEEDAMRGVAAVRRDYINRYSSDVGFRRREMVKNIGRHSLAWMPLVIMLAVQGWRVYETWRPQRIESDPQFERNQTEVKRQIEQANRRIQAITGQIIASDDELRRRADAGEAAAQYTLAMKLLKQTNQELRMREGMALLEAAAAQGYRWALLDLGEYLQKGEHVSKDVERALACFERAAELGSPRAAVLAGEIYLKGEASKPDPVKALALFEQSAAAGNTYGAAMAGWIYEEGEGTQKDLNKALSYYLQAADKNYLWAQERVADILLLDADSPLRDEKEGVRWMRRGAEAGSDRLRFYELIRLVTGLNTANPEDVPKIIKWGKALAEQKDKNTPYAPYAAYGLGHYYWSAAYEPLDISTGLCYFEMAAQRDMPGALFMVAHCKSFGIGTTRDLVGARVLRDKLADMTKRNPEVTEKMIELLDRELAVVGTEIPAEAEPLTPIYRGKPTYPMNLRRRGVKGEALIGFEVGEDGFVSNVEIVKATHPEFGAAALFSVLTWRLAPRRVDGYPARAHMQVPIVFTLSDAEMKKPDLGQP